MDKRLLPLLRLGVIAFLVALAAAAACPAGEAFPPGPPRVAALAGELDIVMCEDPGCPPPDEGDPRRVRLSLRPSGLDRSLPHSEGVGWVRLRFRATAALASEEPAILITRPADADEIHLNGIRIGGEGVVAERFVTVPAGPRLVAVPRGAIRAGANTLSMKVLFAGKNAGALDGPIYLGERDRLVAVAEGMKQPILIMESAFLAMFGLLLGFFGFLILKKVIRSEYVLFTAFTVIYSFVFFLDSNVFRLFGSGGVWTQHVLAVLSSALVPVMIALVANATGAPQGAVFRGMIAGGVLFVLLDSVLPPMTALYLLAVPRKVFLGLRGIYYLYLSTRAFLNRREDSAPILLGVAGYVAGTRIDAFLGLNLKDFGMGIFTLGMIYALTSRHARMRNRLVDLSARLLDAHEEERRRIARDLHDSVGQSLLALRMRLQMLASKGRRGDAPSPDAVEEAGGEILKIIEEVRRTAMDLRPSFLESSGLPEAMKWYAEYFGERRGLSVRIHDPAERIPDLPSRVKDNVYRIFQEILSNAARHAEADRIDISLFRSPGGITLEVADDGKGFDPGKGKSGGMGLTSMKERAELLGGNLQFHSAPGRGTVVTLEVPVP